MHGPGNRATFILDLDGLERDPDGSAGPADCYPPCILERVRHAAESRDARGSASRWPASPPHQLEITVAGDQFCITGEQSRDGETRRFLRRGIAAPCIQRRRCLAG